MSNSITANQREVLAVLDSVTKKPFYLTGNSSTGGLDVNISSATVSGGLTNNNAAPSNDNLGVLPALANAAAPTYTEGNQVLLSTDLSGQLRVTGSLSVGGTVDNSAFTAGSSTGTPAMGFYHSTIDAVTDGHAATVAITANRAQHSNLRNASGAEIGVVGAALIVDGSAVTQPVSAVSLPLPAGAATAAKQPALGTAGTPSSDVLTVQGITSMTALKVDGSAVTQPVSGTVTVTATNLSTNLAQVGGSSIVTATTGVQKVGIAGATAATLDAAKTAATAPTNGLLTLGIYNSTEPTLTTGQSVGVQLDSKGRGKQVIMDAAGNTRGANVTASNALLVDLSATAANTTALKVDGSAVTQPISGTVTANQGGTWTVQPGNTQNTTNWLVAPGADANAKGASLNYQSALTNTKVAVKASAGHFLGAHIYNPNAVVTYIQIFNVASASVTLGSTAPTMVLAVPANGWYDNNFPLPIAFNTAITLAATTTASGSTAPSSTLLADFWYI